MIFKKKLTKLLYLAFTKYNPIIKQSINVFLNVSRAWTMQQIRGIWYVQRELKDLDN